MADESTRFPTRLDVEILTFLQGKTLDCDELADELNLTVREVEASIDEAIKHGWAGRRGITRLRYFVVTPTGRSQLSALANPIPEA